MIGTVVSILTTREAGGVLQPVGQAILESGKGMVGDRYYEHRGTFSKELQISADWEITLIDVCAYLAKLIGPDVVQAMAHRAGLRARIVTGSIVRPGDRVAPHAAAK